MKDIIITSNRLKKELYILLICLGVAFVLNIVGIAIYKTPWSELISSIGYVIIIGIVIYFLFSFIRILICLIRGLIDRMRAK